MVLSYPLKCGLLQHMEQRGTGRNGLLESCHTHSNAGFYNISRLQARLMQITLSSPVKCALLQPRRELVRRTGIVVIPTQMRASTTLSFRATWKNRIKILPKFIPFIFKRLSIAFSVFRKCMHFKIAKQALLQVFTAKPVHNQAHTPQKNFARQKPPKTETPFCEKRHSHTPPASTQQARVREAFSQMNAPGMPAPPFAKNKAGTQNAKKGVLSCKTTHYIFFRFSQINLAVSAKKFIFVGGNL